MVPIAGPVREGIGLLGSPCFEIPRTVQRDHRFDYLATGPERQRRLAAKNRYNAATIGWYLLVRWAYLFGLALTALLTAGSDGQSDILSTAVMITAGVPFTIGYWVLVDRAVARFRRLRPRYARSTSARSGATSASGRCPPPPISICSTARPTKTSSGACWAFGSAAGSSTTAATSWSGAWSAWAAAAR